MNDDLRKIVFKSPTKYRVAYGDKLLDSGIQAYLCAYRADRTRITKTDPIENFDKRMALLKESKFYIQDVEYLSELFLGAQVNIDGANKTKISKQADKIGSYCYEISDIIDSVIKNTNKRKKAVTN